MRRRSSSARAHVPVFLPFGECCVSVAFIWGVVAGLGYKWQWNRKCIFYSRFVGFHFFAVLSLNVSRTTQDSSAKCSRVFIKKTTMRQFLPKGKLLMWNQSLKFGKFPGEIKVSFGGLMSFGFSRHFINWWVSCFVDPHWHKLSHLHITSIQRSSFSFNFSFV